MHIEPNHPQREPERRCQVCGHPASAFWEGTEDIAVCAGCAVEIVTKLIGDAIQLPSGRDSAQRCKSTVQRVTLHLWQALAMRLIRESSG